MTQAITVRTPEQLPAFVQAFRKQAGLTQAQLPPDFPGAVAERIFGGLKASAEGLGRSAPRRVNWC